MNVMWSKFCDTDRAMVRECGVLDDYLLTSTQLSYYK